MPNPIYYNEEEREAARLSELLSLLSRAEKDTHTILERFYGPSLGMNRLSALAWEQRLIDAAATFHGLFVRIQDKQEQSGKDK